MSISVRVHSEVKIANTWHHHAEFSLPDDADTFSLLGLPQQKHLLPAISPAKGLPNDITAITAIHVGICSNDMIYPSWFNAEETCRLLNYFDEKRDPLFYHRYCPYLFGDSLGSFHEFPEEYVDSPIEDVRIVFWFE